MPDHLHIHKIPAKYQGLEFLHLPVALVDNQFNLLHFNSAFAKLMFESDQVFPPKDLEEVFSNYSEIVLSTASFRNDPERYTIEQVQHNRSEKVYNLYVSRIEEKMDHIDGFTVVCVEVPKQQTPTVDSGLMHYHLLVENLSEVVFQTDTEARFSYLNSSWEKLTGISTNDAIGRSCFDFLSHPHDTETFYRKVRKLLSHGLREFQYELLINTASGNKKFVEVSLKPIHNERDEITGINGIMKDVHSRKISELEIKTTQKTLQHHQDVLVSLTKEESIINGNLLDALKHIAAVAVETLKVSCVNIWQFSKDGNTLDCQVYYDRATNKFLKRKSLNYDQFPSYFKILRSERIVISNDVRHDDRISEFKKIYFEPENVFSSMDIAISNGDKIWGMICFENTFTFHKWTLEDQSFARSIADFILLAYESSLLKATQKELVEREDLYRTLIEQATDAIILIDTNDRFIEVNNRMCELTGYTKEELLKMTFDKLIPERFLNHNFNAKPKHRNKNKFFGERIYLNKKGEERIAEISARVFSDGRIQGIARDITERKKQERALKDSEARLELALKGADLGTWDFYIQENKMVHNKRWAEMLGYYFENTVVTQQFWEKFVHPDDQEGAYESFQKHLNGETTFYEASIRMLASNGEWRWILDKGKVVEWDKLGNPVRASGIHQDITAIKIYQQQILHQKTFLQQIVNAIPNLIYVKNINEEFVTINNALADFLGTTPEELLTYNHGKHPAYENMLNKLFEKDFDVFISRKHVYYHEQEIENDRTGKKHWLQSIKVPLVDEEGNFTEILSVSMDITELKNKEHELESLNDKLEQKVAKRTSMLEAANKELETFNYSVSHDLRTPLRSIDIFAYFLDKNYNRNLDKDGIENIRQIRKGIAKMSLLIDNLQIFSKMGRGERKNDLIDTSALINELLIETKEREIESGHKIIMTHLPQIRGDYSMFKQAFSNLISNAIKFSKIRTHPEIEFSGYEDEESVTISIRDNGVGFSMEYRDKLFKAFKRLHSDEQFEGTGVGLAIVERIVKRHSGSIWAESAEDKGTTFFIKLPK
ncbi:MAG: PAS domain S-box protein [Chitinophagales bacterium]